jgi:predicted transposase/invertase (TIGR01784 family)
MEELTVEEPALKKAMNTLEFLSQDEETRRLYEERQKALRDEASMIEGAKEEGRNEGRVEGQMELISALLKNGMKISEVAKYTGLTMEEVSRLLSLH